MAVAIIGATGLHEKSGGTPHLVSPSTTSGGSSTVSSGTSSAQTPTQGYKDGTYTGATEETPYGPVEVSVVISSGKITNVNFLQMPSDLAHSQLVTQYSEPLLKQETIQRQNPANLDFVSGATVTSEGYMQSLQAALDHAAIS